VPKGRSQVQVLYFGTLLLFLNHSIWVLFSLTNGILFSFSLPTEPNRSDGTFKKWSRERVYKRFILWDEYIETSKEKDAYIVTLLSHGKAGESVWTDGDGLQGKSSHPEHPLTLPVGSPLTENTSYKWFQVENTWQSLGDTTWHLISAVVIPHRFLEIPSHWEMKFPSCLLCCSLLGVEASELLAIWFPKHLHPTPVLGFRSSIISFQSPGAPPLSQPLEVSCSPLWSALYSTQSFDRVNVFLLQLSIVVLASQCSIYHLLYGDSLQFHHTLCCFHTVSISLLFLLISSSFPGLQVAGNVVSSTL
jgi:hypothetical protein